MVMGTVVSTMQAGSGGVSQKRGRAGLAMMVSREARAAVMKAATATHYMVVEEAGVGTAVQVAVIHIVIHIQVVVAPGTLAAA